MHRERTGRGQHIELSMLDTVVSFLWSSDMGGHTFVGDEMENEKAQSFIDLIYETKDGHVSVAVMQNKEWQAFAACRRSTGAARQIRASQTASLREENKDERLNAMQEAIGQFETDGNHCAARAKRCALRAGADAARNDPPSPDCVANDLVVVEVEHPHVRSIAVSPALPGTVLGNAGIDVRRRSPGSWRATLPKSLSEGGFAPEEIREMRASGAAVQADSDGNGAAKRDDAA